MPIYPYQSGTFSLGGSVSFELVPEGIKPWRIPHARRSLYPVLRDQVAQECSGVRVRCLPEDVRELALHASPQHAEAYCDLVIANELHQTTHFRNGAFRFRLPPGHSMEPVELWLDQRSAMTLHALEVDQGLLHPYQPKQRPRWIHYGSSISHCRDAHSPARTWPALTARKLDLDLTNLGFGGQCQIEPMMGILIRDLPADFITLKLGINLHRGNLTERTFPANVIGLIHLIREKHPTTPMAVISPIYSPDRETTRASELSLTLTEMRQELAGIVAMFQRCGDHRICYQNGLDLFGSASLPYLPDRLHPDGDGQFVLAEAMTGRVFPVLQKMKQDFPHLG